MPSIAEPPPAPARILDPIDRVSEILFGLFMALTFTGTFSVVTADRHEVRTMMLAAIGCNVAWGLVDGVMFALRSLVSRSREASLVRTNAAHAQPVRLGRHEVLGALGVFLLVVAATFPLILPFALIPDLYLAKRISHVIALLMLFACGYAWGRYAGMRPLRVGAVMVCIGSAITAVVIALGG
jgi:hypothetical protein